MDCKFILLIVLLAVTGCLYAVTNVKFDYDSAWKEIQKLQDQGLPKSMLEKVDVVYQAAVLDNKTDQQIKALIFQLSAQQYTEEFSAQKAIDLVKSKTDKASFPSSAILHSMLAQTYWSYYQSNRWKYQQRTETINFNQDDIATWDLKAIAKATMSEYALSLNYASELQKINVMDYPAIINKGNEYTIDLQPTLYDFLAQRALDFYINDESGLSLPFEEFTITDTKFFSPAASFVVMGITSADSLSLKYLALKLYQDLTLFHLNDKDPSALLDVDLDRLDFVYDNCTIADPETYYEAALRLDATKYKNFPISTYAYFKLATMYNTQAALYKPEVSEDYRWHYKLALELCNQAINSFPKSFGGRSCSEFARQIQEKTITMLAENIVIPLLPIKAQLTTKNLSQVQVRAYQIPQMSDESFNNQNYFIYDSNGNLKLEAILKRTPKWSKTFAIENEGDFRSHIYDIALEALPVGKYLILASDDFSLDYQTQIIGYYTFNSSELSYILNSTSSNILLISNRNNGLPIANATVTVYKREYNKQSNKWTYKKSWTGLSNRKGIVTVAVKQNDYDNQCIISKGADSLAIGGLYNYNNSYTPGKAPACLLFTDRSIYRPGQTIYLKGVIFETNGEKSYKILPGKSVTATFYDVNQQIVGTQNLTSNEYGTFNTTFTAPKGVLTGQMFIQADHKSSVYFSVEEYKRPKFEVTIDKPKESYKLGQNVTVTGKALSYAGFPIDNATVDYRIIRQPKYPYWFWWWGAYPSTPEKEISHGTLTADEKGEFTLSFMALGDEEVAEYGSPYFAFTVNADVTDLSGETRTGSLSLYIGQKELVLDAVVPEKVDNETKQLTIPVKTTNLSGEKISASGTVTISRLQTPDHIQKSRLWTAPDRNYLSREEFLKLFPNDIYGKEDNITKWQILSQVFTGKFDTPEVDSVLIKGLDKWAPGVYVLEAVASYKQQEVKTSRYFTIYASDSKQMPYPMADWYVPVKVICEPGETAKLLIGSAYDDMHVMYEVEKDHKIVDSLSFNLSNAQRLFSLPVTEQDRGSFYVHFTFIKDGRFYNHDQEITVPWTNKKLDFEYMTFRDKLLPGQKEEWRLKLKDYTGGAVTAEVLASMYDASLDAFSSSQWSANVYGKVSQTNRWYANNFVGTAYLNQLNYNVYYNFPSRTYNTLNWFNYQTGWYSERRYKGYGGGRNSVDGMSVSDAMAAPMMSMSPSGSGSKSIQMESYKVTAKKDEIEKSAGGTKSTGAINTNEIDLNGIQARTNFAETAFFYPELRTDEAGDVSIVFTVPEALTRWKFRAMALTQDLKIGLTDNTTVTQKPLMVIPNAPRFLREGDKITFASKITSMDESDQSGVCQLMLFDALSMAPVDKDFGLSKAQQSFSVKKGESTVLNWDLTIPFGINAVTYRVVAKAGDFSDGEENTLPILTNRMLVTESLPLPVRGKTSKSFTFEKLKNSMVSKTIRNFKLTLEFTSNPAWYAVQALPYMMEYPYGCNEQIFTHFYATSLAAHIANSSPKIKKVFDSWKNTPNSSALLSNLEKNQELKSVILEETPWVLDAKNESQSKQRIGLLFDLNNLADQFENSLSQLKKNQSPSGAWPWFPGMEDSWWVTQYIVEGLGHLDHLKVKAIREDTDTWSMTQNAIEYLDRKILEDYNNIVKYGNLELDNLGYMEMHYLYTRSYFLDLPIPKDVSVAVEYFKGQTDKYWLSKDIYGQGLIALAMHRFDKEIVPNKIIASLKERALHNEELGMWWKDNNYGWYWYQAPIETQSLLIEAFTDVAKDSVSIDDMRTWLLKQKQTTNWKTTKATAEACYALLLSGTEWLNTDKLAEISIGGKGLDPTTLEGVQVEAGTGYFKTSWNGDAITPAMAEVSIKNPNDVPAWGSLYWQYFENLDKITSAETPLKLNKKLFLERTTDTGLVLDPISDKTVLGIGDKVIVRIELRSDRDMEYVHMKDMRSSGFEPINVISRYKWQDGLGYYEATGDAATNFFIEYLHKGTYVFEYPLRVTNKGDFSNGITTIQCMYAPEFTSHSEGIRVEVK